MIIYKYKIDSLGKTTIQLPIGASILDIQAQKNYVTMWMLVDKGQPLVPREFIGIMTGKEIIEEENKDMKFIKTVQLNDESFVTHIFEIIDRLIEV